MAHLNMKIEKIAEVSYNLVIYWSLNVEPRIWSAKTMLPSSKAVHS